MDRPPLPHLPWKPPRKRCASLRTAGTRAIPNGSRWQRELDYRLIKEIWGCRENRIAVRCEWHDDSGQSFRSYGNENWEFDVHGLMRVRHASINDAPIQESDRRSL